MMLWRWIIREHFVSEAYLRMYLSDCLQILHTTQQLCLLRHMNSDPLLVQYYDLFNVLTHTSFPEQISKLPGLLESYCTYMLSTKDYLEIVLSCAFSGF